MLKGRKIILGVTGSIAAYKAAQIIRLLVKNGAEVKVIMTPTAKHFITPLTLATLAKNPILVEFFDPENGAWNSHVSLGEWADAYLIAPATAATMGKMVSGVADNLLVTTYLSAKCPVFIAPAMDLDMYKHPSTQNNIETLRKFGNQIVEPGSGELASGLIGKGRMAEPEEIVAQLNDYFSSCETLRGKTVLVNAGATVERIDPVRYISNDSSGKMGCAIARQLANRGAQVILVAGKMSVDVDDPRIKKYRVESAQQMRDLCLEHFKSCDAAVLSAAVADYTPVVVHDQKLKKGAAATTIELKPTPDIASEMGKIKGNRILVGFALETENETENAQSKLKRKNFNFIVLNSLRDSGAGFGHDTNKISIIRDDESVTDFMLKDKEHVAVDVVDELERYFSK